MYCPVSLAGLGEALRAEVRRRAAGGMSVSVLSRRTGVSQEQLCNWLAERRNLSSESQDLVRAVLGVGLCELYRDCGECAWLTARAERAARVVELRPTKQRRRPWRRRVDPVVVAVGVMAFLATATGGWWVALALGLVVRR